MVSMVNKALPMGEKACPDCEYNSCGCTEKHHMLRDTVESVSLQSH